MVAFLTLLSVLAGWSLLIVLLVALVLILKRLEGVRSELRRIAMGVRAIEQQSAPLGPSSSALAADLRETAEGFGGAAAALTQLESHLGRAGRSPGSR